MKKITLLASLVIIMSMVFSCQTLKKNEPPGPAGTYLAKTSTPQGEIIEFTLTINKDGTGTLEALNGKSEFSNAEINANNFKFATTINTQMGQMGLTFLGTVNGDNIEGNIGAQMGQFLFTGVRQKI